MLRKIFLLPSLLCLVSCSGQDGNIYFPLNKGLSWTYLVTTSYPDETNQEKLKIENLGKKNFGDKSYFIRRSSYGIDYYLNSDNDGLYREAIRTLVENKPRPDSNKRFVLKFPLEEGTNWQQITHPMILLRGFPNRMIESSFHVPMNYHIESTSETVTVPAGTFENCLLIIGDGVTEIYTDGVNGYTDIPFRVEEWYAPNVGLVKQVRYEMEGQSIMVAVTPIFLGGRKTLELLAFK